MEKTWAILVAGGTGTRFGGPTPKQFLPLAGRRVLDHALDAFVDLNGLDGLVLVLPESHLEVGSRGLENRFSIPVTAVAGGATRQASVTRGLAQVPDEVQWIMIHDVARPLVTTEVIARCLQGARETGAAVTAIPVADTLKRGRLGEAVVETVDRQEYFQIQTPQVFARDLLAATLHWAKEQGLDATDEATLFEKRGLKVRLVEGSRFNFKITRPEDFALAGGYLAQRDKGATMDGIRIGQGYDVHPWVEGRKLILGGVEIPFEKGLQGHSDADALCHAIGDALLGAAAAGDLGQHFPDSDPQFKGVSSLKLLEAIANIIKKKGFLLANLDATLICQRPKLAPFIPQMREKIAEALGVSPEQISVKATTEEGLGFTGRGEGLAAKAVALLQRDVTA